MKDFIKVLCFLLIAYVPVSEAVPLSVGNIEANIGNLNNAPGAVPDANKCFAFKEFIEESDHPAPVSRIPVINRLRGLLNSQDFLDNVRPYLQNTEFLSNRLLKLEIEYGNPGNDLNINPRTQDVTNMMVRIEIPGEGSASGILIPVPDIFNPGDHHSWGILTCGHILEDLPIEKTLNALQETFNARLNIAGVPNPILIHSIKIFKTDSFRLENKNGFVYEGFGDNIFNAQDIRAIPRYEYPGDTALCYLNLTLDQISAINLAKLAAPTIPGVYPHIQRAGNSISFQSLEGFTYNFKLVTDATRDDLVAEVNAAHNNDNSFVLGYAKDEVAADGYVLTLSKGRGIATQIYGGGFIDPNPHPGNNRMFFHDAPTYSGMSGGAVFNTPEDVAHDHEINIFGVVHGYDSPDLPNALPHNLQSRCSASFIMEILLN